MKLPACRGFFASAMIAAAFLFSACNTEPALAPSIGDAFIGPATLNLRKEIDTKSRTVAVTHHGDHVEIVSQKRLWYKVRTAKGIEGWTEDHQLLDAGQMTRLRKLAEETAGLPSQGKATTYDVLNVHAEPDRTSPSFVQIGEKETFDVITHRVTVRTNTAPKRVLTKPKAKPTAMPRKGAKNGKNAKSGAPPDMTPLPPPPAAPKPPVDWVALSKERAAPAEADTPPAAHDDWTLVRTQSGQSGWALTSRVYMLVPDDVAQYAEGHRITSYFSIGSVYDQGEKKDIWLWTTIESLGEDYDFDSYRVFTWNERRHRYETAYIQRRERGYLPVIAKQGEFSVCVVDKDGARVRRSYSLIGNTVKPSGVRPCEMRAESDLGPAEDKPIQVHEAMPVQQGYVAQFKAKWKQWFGKKSTTK